MQHAMAVRAHASHVGQPGGELDFQPAKMMYLNKPFTKIAVLLLEVEPAHRTVESVAIPGQADQRLIPERELSGDLAPATFIHRERAASIEGIPSAPHRCQCLKDPTNYLQRRPTAQILPDPHKITMVAARLKPVGELLLGPARPNVISTG